MSFYNTLSNTEKFNNTLGLGNSTIKVEKTWVLSDQVAPNASLVDTKIDEVKNNSVTIRTKYQKGEYECYGLVSEKNVSNFTFDDLDFKTPINSQPGYGNNNYTLKYEQGFTNNVTYNIILGCYNIPNSTYNYRQSDLVVSATFRYNDDNKNKTDQKCDKNKDPFCDKRSKKLPDIKNNPKKDNLKKINEFKNMTVEEKKAYLSDNVKKLADVNSTVDKLQAAIFISDLVSATNCSEGYNSVSECEVALSKLQEDVVSELDSKLKCDTLVKVLNDTYNKTSTPEDNIKLSLISIFGLTANVGALSNNGTTKVANMTNCFLSTAKDIFKVIETNAGKEALDSKKDVIKLLLSVSSNLLDVLYSNQNDGTTKDTPKNQTNQLLINEQTKLIRDNINKNVPLLLQYGDEVESTENFGFIKRSVTKSTPARNLQSNNTNVTYVQARYQRNGLNFTIHLPNDYLVTVNKNIALLGGVVYDEYPLLAYGNKNFSERVVGLKFYDAQASPVNVSDLAHAIHIDFPAHPSNFTKCVFFNESLNDWSNEGVTSTVLADGSIRCSTTHLTDFTIGNVDYGTTTDVESSNTLLIVLIIVGVAILVAVIIFLVCYCKKKNNNSDILINEGGNRDIQMKKI